jgi:GNAT superfamily N-acetyltransferase
MKKTILVRGVDEEAYRRAKAAAALKGQPIGRAVSEALEEWAKREDEDSVYLEVEEDRDFVRRSWRQLSRHRGKAVVVASRKLQGVFETYEQAAAFAPRFRVALTFVVDTPPKEHELEIGPDLEL